MNRLILASASPRRAHLLRSVGLDFEVRPAHIDETVQPGEDPAECALRLAADKANACLAALEVTENTVILGVDTVVVLGEEILGKPADAGEAVHMLARLAGQTHRVISGWCLLRGDGESRSGHGLTEVEMIEARPDVLEAYAATGEPLDKAGAYGIQGIGGFLVRRIDGSYSNVVGLPLVEVLDELERFAEVRPWKLPT